MCCFNPCGESRGVWPLFLSLSVNRIYFSVRSCLFSTKNWGSKIRELHAWYALFFVDWERWGGNNAAISSAHVGIRIISSSLKEATEMHEAHFCRAWWTFQTKQLMQRINWFTDSFCLNFACNISTKSGINQNPTFISDSRCSISRNRKQSSLSNTVLIVESDWILAVALVQKFHQSCLLPI